MPVIILYFKSFLVNLQIKLRPKTYKEREVFMKPIGFDIFSGAGGLSLGAQWAGIDVRTAIEINPSAAKTYKRNHPTANVIQGDIQEIDAKNFVSKEEPVFIIMGGPPCQGFSMSNTMSRNMDNPKNLLFREFVRFVRDIKPEWFLFENVWGFTKMEQGHIEDMIQCLFESLGYKVKHAVLWAHEYGVPQKRNRFFMVGNRSGIDFEFPEPNTKHIVTVKEAIDDLPPLKNGEMRESAQYTKTYAQATKYERKMRKGSKEAKQNFVSRNNDLVIQRYHYIGQGQNWRAIPDFLMQNYADKGRCHSGIYKRLKEDEPSVVISNYRKSMLIHPTEDRGISVREAARLQSFPDTFIFDGPISHIQQQIGNAVPPLLAKAVFDKILSYYPKDE